MPKPDVEDLALRAAILFEESEEVYSVPINYPAPYPRRYAAMGLGEAAIDAMAEADFTTQEMATNFALREQIEEAARGLVDDWRDVTTKREITAFILNRYSAIGFNPN